MAIVPTFFQAIQARKISFTILQNKKTTFQFIKTRSSKSRKIDIFSKGLTHRFGPKMAIFQFLFFQSIQARKMSFTIFYKEKTLFQAIKRRRLKSPNIDIFPKGLTHGFGPRMARFPLFFQAIQARKMCFTILYNKKNSFLGYKNEKFKTSKN